ncbi:10537_t:CDS:2 [Entrophospora sp. SA101]|nr:10537_t:CDS:2 [Entrophospora sp. SA101]
MTDYFLRSGNFQTLYLHKNNIKEIWTYYMKIKVSKLVYKIGHIFEMKLLIYLIKNNDLIKARIVTETLKKKNETCYFEWLDNYLKIVNKLFNKDLSGAIELFKKIISNGNQEVIPNKMHSILLTELVKANKINDAENFLKLISSVRKMQCKRVSTHYYNILMAGHVKEKKLENALEILQQMSKNNVKPNRCTYNILINFCAKLSKVDLAEKLFSKMKSVDIPPNVLSYSGIIEAHGNVMDLDSCIKYFKQMEEANVRPNIYTYCILITAYARTGNFQEAVKWFRHMVILSRIQPNLKNITSLMVALTKDFKNDPALLDKIFGLIRNEGLQSDVVAYTALINAKAKVLDLKAAIIAYQQMLEESIKPNIYTYTVLLDASAKLGNFSSTIKFFNDMRKGDIEPNQYTYCVIMNVYANNNQLDKAFEIFDQMRTKGISPDTTCINCLMDACNRLGYVDKVFYLYSIMKSELNIEPDNSTFTIFIDSCSFNNEAYHGIKFFQNLLKQNQTLNVNNFGSFINLLGRHGFSRNILNALRLMKKLSIKPSKYRTILPALNYVYSIGFSLDQVQTDNEKSKKNGLPFEIIQMKTKKKKIEINMRDERMVKFVDEWKWITKDLMLVFPMPCKKTVNCILDEFLEYKLEKLDGNISPDSNVKKTTQKHELTETINGMKIYFNEELPISLLYRFERQQYLELVEKYLDHQPASIYGAEHLMRLIVLIPDLVNDVQMNEEKAQQIQILFQELYEYSFASPAYIRVIWEY